MSTNFTLQGVVVPLLTPFTAGGENIDLPALRRLIDRLIGAGVQGLIVNASTSEFYHLDDKERREAAEVAVSHCAGRVPMLVGAGAVATRHAMAWARHAEAIGANGLLIMPPYYEPVTVDAIVRHYSTISDATALPIMLYNTPFATQVLLTPSDIERLIGAANIPWVKLTTKVLEQVCLILERVGDRVTLFEGVDTLAFQSMASGSCGWIAGPANAIPELAVELWRLICVDRDLPRSYALHRRLLPLLDFAVNGHVSCSLLKEICGLRGYPCSATREPFDELNEAERRRAHRLAADLGLIDGIASSSHAVAAS